MAAELELLGPDGSKVTVAAVPTQPEGFKEVNKFRYALPSGFIPQTGEYQVRFLTGTWSDNSATTNAARTEKIRVSAPSAVFAAPAGGGTIDRVALNTDKTISVYFKPVGGGTIDEATILDAAPEFTLSGTAAQGITLGVPTKSTENDFEYRYPFTGTFGMGLVDFAIIAGSFADKKQNLNTASTGSFTVTGAVAALSGPAQDIKELNAARLFGVQLYPDAQCHH
ncbi:MAG UNVERIFIED_CONTAM: hypothetical protein LVR18_39925 [Planctomycetaceae bacterium]